MTTSFALTLQTWSFDKQEQSSISDLLARVNNERGHFREITEASLQEELATEGALQLSDSEEEDEAEGDEHDNIIQPKSREDLYRAKYDMLQKINFAHNEVMMALDFVSLLASKDSAAGKQTMSQYLRENIPAGTLGTDIWHRMPKDQAREQQDLRLAHNVRLEALQDSADNILSAAKDLEDNVRRETKYWDEILSVSDKGWKVCRMPGQRHKLGVRFGFEGGSPEFERRGLAALHADADGAVSMDRSAQSKYMRIRVLVKRDDQIVGRSTLGDVEKGDDTLESRIRQARESLFDEEMFREMQKEARSLASDGVVIEGQQIALPAIEDANALKITFELVHTNAVSTAEPDGGYNNSAQGILCIAKLLVCQFHRKTVEKRSQIPPPMSERKIEQQPALVLRALMTCFAQYTASQQINNYLTDMSNLLSKADIKSIVQSAPIQILTGDDLTNAGRLMAELTSPYEAVASLTLPQPKVDPLSISIVVRTSIDQRNRTSFVVRSQGESELQLSSFKQAATLISRLIERLVCSALANHAGNDWILSRADASIHRIGDSMNERVNKVVVSIDRHEQSLQLATLNDEKKWSLHDDSYEGSLFGAWQAMVSEK